MLRLMILSARKKELTSPQFFDHLRHRHWPLLQNTPDVLGHIRSYVQNHVFASNNSSTLAAPFPCSGSYESVIELAFADLEHLHRMSAAPSYMTRIRPDENAFNDQQAAIMTPCRETVIFEAKVIGRVRRFDFIRLLPNGSAEVLSNQLEHLGKAFALDPIYQAVVDRRAHYLPYGEGNEAFTFSGSFDAIVATSLSGLDGLAVLDRHFDERLAGVADPVSSLSVFATAFQMHEAL